MLFKNLTLFALILSSYALLYGQDASMKISMTLSVDDEIKSSFKSEGRLLIYFSEEDKGEPRYVSIYSGQGAIFGKNIQNWQKDEAQEISGDNWLKTSEWDLNSVPSKVYYVQAVWKQNLGLESQPNSPGNLYSESVKIEPNQTRGIEISLASIIPERKLVEHEQVELFSIESEVLGKWWNKPMNVKASVLLPSGYAANPDKKYPVRYNVAGYGGRYTRVNRLVKNDDFMSWWSSKDAPQIITVFLDGEGPYGDSYQLDSENSGPYGETLINELIPKIEATYRIIGSPQMRFVDGCSTGGWVSLALQLYYPESFNGCWSYSPDPVNFEKMQLMNIYEDENAFYNKNNYLRPSMRDVNGDPLFSIKQEVISENVVGVSDSYVTSGGQWGAWNALYSAKGTDGLPKPLFDPVSGTIDSVVVQDWKKYDLLLFTSTNWAELGPKIQGKIHVWMGDMDNFYLNTSMRDFDAFLKNTSKPKSDAEIEFTPMKGHCSNYSHKHILQEIDAKLKGMKKTTE